MHLVPVLAVIASALRFSSAQLVENPQYHFFDPSRVRYFLWFDGGRVKQPDGHQPRAALRPLTCQQWLQQRLHNRYTYTLSSPSRPPPPSESAPTHFWERHKSESSGPEEPRGGTPGRTASTLLRQPCRVAPPEESAAFWTSASPQETQLLVKDRQYG